MCLFAYGSRLRPGFAGRNENPVNSTRSQQSDQRIILNIANQAIANQAIANQQSPISIANRPSIQSTIANQ
jgi:hypothetical protein